MDRFTIIFASDQEHPNLPAPGWERDYILCEKSGAFDVLLVDLDRLLSGERPCPRAPHRDTPTILRCDRIPEPRYKALEAALIRSGHRLVMGTGEVFSKTAWFDHADSREASVLRAREGTGGTIGDSRSWNAPAQWRVYYFDGLPFCKIPLFPEGIPATEGCSEPPESLIKSFSHRDGLFHVAEFAENPGPHPWRCKFNYSGQFGTLPPGTPDDFYELLNESIQNTPHWVPKGIWCLTGRVVDENRTGEQHKVVHGTRHFAPGIKLYLEPPHWDGRVTVIGVPRYGSKPTRVTMDIDKVEDFAAEWVEDPTIVRGICCTWEEWPFVPFKSDHVTRITWDDRGGDKDAVEKCIAWLSEEAARRKADKEAPPHARVKPVSHETVSPKRSEPSPRDARGHTGEAGPADPLELESRDSTRLGTAELWADTTWTLGLSERNLELERDAKSVQQGDRLLVKPLAEQEEGWGYAFETASGHRLPYEPYSDTDDGFFSIALESLDENEMLECVVVGTSAVGDDGVPGDPDFCWRIYTCKVVVFKANADAEGQETHFDAHQQR